MRISKFMLPTIAVVGALALAGCGGGSDMSDDDGNGGGNGENGASNGENGKKPENTSSALTIAKTGLTRTQVPTGSHRLDPEGTLKTPNGTITCPEAATGGCIVTVGPQSGSPVVTVTGGATYKADPTPAEAKKADRDRLAGANAGGTAAQGGGDWLGDASIIRAVKSDGRIEITRDGVDYVILDAAANAGGTFDQSDAVDLSGSGIGSIEVDAGGGLETDLRLVHTRNRNIDAVDPDRDRGLAGDYLVFGAWETRTAAQDRGTDVGTGNPGASIDVDAPNTNPIAQNVWAGTIRRTDPQRWGIGSARYEGKALGHYKFGDGSVGANNDWSEWDGKVELRANFADRVELINGTVEIMNYAGSSTPPTGATGASAIDTINLRNTAIESSVHGSANIGGDGTGSWEAGFFGSATNGQPTGVAGAFETSRIGVTGHIDARVQGAFGAHNVDVLLDTLDQ